MNFADDAEFIRLFLDTALRKRGYTVWLAANGKQAIRLFKELGRPEQAKQLLAIYMQIHANEPRGFFDLERSPLGGEVKEQDVRAAFTEKLSTLTQDRDAKTILVNVTKNSGWNPEDIEWLATLSADDFERLFRDNRGYELRAMIRAALQFGTFGNASLV